MVLWVPVLRVEPEHEVDAVTLAERREVLADQLGAHRGQDLVVPASLDLDCRSERIGLAGVSGLNGEVVAFADAGSGFAADFDLAVDDQAALGEVAADMICGVV